MMWNASSCARTFSLLDSKQVIVCEKASILVHHDFEQTVTFAVEGFLVVRITIVQWLLVMKFAILLKGSSWCFWSQNGWHGAYRAGMYHTVWNNPTLWKKFETPHCPIKNQHDIKKNMIVLLVMMLTPSKFQSNIIRFIYSIKVITFVWRHV